MQGSIFFSDWQPVLALVTSRSWRAEIFINGEPVLLLRSGRPLRRARVTEEQLKAAARSEGLRSLDEVEAIMLETNGQLSVIWHPLPAGRVAEQPVDRVPGYEPQGVGRS